MTPEEFQSLYHVRRASGPRSCTGDSPCVHAAEDGACRWYCRASMTVNGNRLALGPRPEGVVCDLHAPFRVNPFPDPGATPSVG